MGAGVAVAGAAVVVAPGDGVGVATFGVCGGSGAVGQLARATLNGVGEADGLGLDVAEGDALGLAVAEGEPPGLGVGVTT